MPAPCWTEWLFSSVLPQWPLPVPGVPCLHMLSLWAELRHPITLFPQPLISRPDVLLAAPQGSQCQLSLQGLQD